MTGPAGVSVQSAVEVAGGPGGGAVWEETLVLEDRQSTVTAAPTLALMVRIYISVHSLCEYPYRTSFSATYLLLNTHIYLCPTSYSYSFVSVLSVLSVYKFMTGSSWGEWGSWGECSMTCQGGTRLRRRQCTNGNDCPGSNVEVQYCNTGTPCDGSKYFSLVLILNGFNRVISCSALCL